MAMEDEGGNGCDEGDGGTEALGGEIGKFVDK
jgi:hypothetical protein